MSFELIVFDTKEQAEAYPFVVDGNYVQRATYVGEALCGVHYRGRRPNKLTRLHRPLETDMERLWERECLLPAMGRRWKVE